MSDVDGVSLGDGHNILLAMRTLREVRPKKPRSNHNDVVIEGGEEEEVKEHTIKEPNPLYDKIIYKGWRFGKIRAGWLMFLKTIWYSICDNVQDPRFVPILDNNVLDAQDPAHMA